MEGNEIVRGHSTHVTLQPFIHQVGGHSSIQQIDHSTVCKPLFSKELRFYEDVCPAFKPFIPKFEGVVTVRNPSEGEDNKYQVTSSRDDIRLHVYRYGKHCNTCSCRREGYVSKTSGQGTEAESFSSDEEFDKNTSTLNSDGHSHDDSSLEYIRLENVVGHYKYPCILDLKMGTEKHKDYVISKEEADRRQARWDETTSKSLGVRVCGMKVYLVNKSGFFAKSGGRDLTIQGFKDAIKTFLYNGERSRCDVIEPFLKQLGELLNVMENQSSYRFYNTSLLLIYEGEYYTRTDEDIVDCKNNFDDSQLTLPNGPKKSCANVSVRMIDFAHVHYNNQSSNSGLRHVRDESYLFGLRSVIQILKETLVELRTKEPCIS